MTNESERDLEVLLSYLVNKKLQQAEVILALGISRSNYRYQMERGTLCCPGNLICAAQYFGLNPLDLLVHYGHVTPDEVAEYAERSANMDPPVIPKGGTTVHKRSSTKSHHIGSAI